MAHDENVNPRNTNLDLDLLGAEIHEFDNMMPITDGGDHRDPTGVSDRIRGMMEEAVTHYQDNLEPDQVEATDMYYGRPLGDEETGRSQVISTDVKDATQSQIPDLMRIFMGADNTVEFRPQNAAQVALAKQQTDYINYIVREENPGYLVFHSAFKDALVRRTGYFKWWWEDYDTVKGYSMSGISEQGLMLLEEDEDVDYQIINVIDQGEAGLAYDVEVTYFESTGRARFDAVPPEEVVWTPDAKSFEDAALVAHVREVTVDEAIRVTGLDIEEIEKHVGKRDQPGSETLSWSRQFHGQSQGDSSSTAGDETELPLSQRPVLLTEAYAKMDLDGDDVAELRLFHCLGPDYEVVNGAVSEDGDFIGEIINQVPMSYITPDPEPHTIVGLSNFDNMKDIQRIKSQVQRAMLNSLAMAVEPQMEVVTGEVNLKDVVSPEINGIIRVRKPGMLREIRHTFVGGEALGVLEHFNDVRADRGGMTRASEGLDPDSLQSSTAEAVSATLGKAQQRVENIARTFAETGVKRLYQGLLELVTENQDRVRTVELRGSFVEVDPRAWNVNAQVRVNPALGTGSLSEKVAVLTSIAGDQQALLTAGSPLVSNVEVRNVRTRILELSGFIGDAEFYRPWGQQEEQAMQEQIANTPPPPDPALLLIDAEREKNQMQSIIKQQELKLKEQDMLLKDDRERDSVARDSVLRIAEAEAEFEAKINDQQVKRDIAADRKAQGQGD